MVSYQEERPMTAVRASNEAVRFESERYLLTTTEASGQISGAGIEAAQNMIPSADILSPHPASALEYWFFKVNAGPVALLVDWIARRRRKEYVLRVSIHSPQQRAVLFNRLPAPMLEGRNYITTRRTVGHLGDVAWSLDIDCDDERIEPDIFPARLLQMTDLTLVSAPLAAFTGQIRHGSLHVELDHAPGMIAHYWGRQLAYEWWWVSANQFDRDGVAVECVASRSSLWGLPVRIPLAYLYLWYGNTRKLIISPPAIARAKGTPEKFEIQFRPFAAKTITLRAQGREYGDLGDGIVNTLVGDLDIWEGDQLMARAEGTAGLERRAPPLRGEGA